MALAKRFGRSDGRKVAGAAARHPSTAQSPIAPWLRHFVHVLDNSIRVPGTGWRLGLDPLIGLLPVIGDWIGVGLSCVMLAEAARLGARRRTLVRMLINIGLEGTVGALPIAGDIWDAWFKSNQRNLQLLERDLAPQTNRLGAGQTTG